MSGIEVLIVIALAIAAIELLDSRGRNKLAWSTMLLSIALLWGPLLNLFTE